MLSYIHRHIRYLIPDTETRVKGGKEMNPPTGDSKKKQITGGVVVKGEEKEPIQVPEGTDFETGALVKLAQNPETAIEIKVGNVQIVKLTEKEDGLSALYIPATDQVLVVDEKQVTPEQHAAIRAKDEALVKAQEEGEK